MRSVRAIALTAALTCVAALAAPARADDRAAVTALNAPMKSVQDDSKSWRMVFEACAAMTAPPVKAEELDALAVWPGMQGWDQVKAWAAANGPVREALMNAQKRRVFGAPYGRGSVPPAMVEKGLYVGIGDGVKVSVAEPRYLRVLDLMTGYVTAEMYRLGEEGKFDDAFDLGIATLRVLRQVADQHLLEEKSWALSEMCDLCSVQRDVLQTFLDKVPAATLKRVAKSGYPMVHPSDSERLRRLEMPEGDRVLAEAMLLQLFDSRGQPDSSKFASTMGDLQAREEPLGAFGAARRWQSIAQVHGSLDLTRKALTNIYDDWWRRWRLGYYEEQLQKPTKISVTNKVRYAMVLLMVKDLERAFFLRQRLNAELNGTVLVFGVCASYRDSGSWPRGIDTTYTQYTVKRFDRDPWNPEWAKGAGDRWQYEVLASPRPIETDFGRLEVSGALVFSYGADRQDGRAAKATMDGVSGDLVVWPALRALSRAQAQGAK